MSLFYLVRKNLENILLCMLILSLIAFGSFVIAGVVNQEGEANHVESTSVISTTDAARINLQAGEALYSRCLGCHSPSYNRTGPKHCGIANRKAGSVEGFVYTDAMRASGIVWNENTLDQFLQSPLAFVPGTSMGYFGVESDQERELIVTYLLSLTSLNSACD